MGGSGTSSSSTEGVSGRRPSKRKLYATIRWLHVYVSMGSFLTILFFAVTGIALNHPEWAMNTSQTVADFDGQLPDGWRTGGDVDWLVVTDYLRAQHGVRGTLADYRSDEFEGSVAFRAPGYNADAFFDPASGSYQLTVVQMGPAGFLNELHRGNDAGAGWGWLIDLAGVFLTLLGLTGIGLLLYLKKFRPSGLVVMAGGGALLVFLVLALMS
jgi:uncharacterized protein